jgi:hypothetical protein
LLEFAPGHRKDLTSGRNCTIIGAAYSWEQSSFYYWRPRADNVKKRLDQLPPTWSHVFEVHAKIVVDLLLAPPRQKYHKVKHYFGFFRFFLKNKKIRNFGFLRIFGF